MKNLLEFLSSIKRIIFFVFFFCSVSLVQAATITSTAIGGTWSLGTTWVGGVAPTSTDDVVIAIGSTVTLIANASCASITFPGTSTNNKATTIAIGINTLTVTGTISYGSHTGSNMNTFSRVTILTGTLNAGSISFTDTKGRVEFSGAGALNITSGNFGSGGTLTASTSTVNFTGTGNQTIGTYNYNNLSTGTSGIKSPTTNLTIGGDLTVGGTSTLDLAGFTANRTTAGGTITIGNGATLKIGSTNTFPTNYTNNAINSAGTVEYYGSNQAIANKPYGNLTLSGTGTKSTTTNITAAGTMAVNSNIIFSPGATNTIGGTGSLTGSGTILVNRTSANADLLTQYTIAGNVGSSLTGLTVDYGGSGNQTVNALSYGNLKTSGSGIKTASGNLTIAGNLSVQNSTTLDLANFTANRTTSGGILDVANGTTFKIGNTNTFPINFLTNTLDASSTVEYSGTNQSIANHTYGNLILSGSGTKTLPGGSMVIAGNFTTMGTVTANSNGALSIGGNITFGSGTGFSAGSFTHNVGGNWINNGATIDGGSSTIVFNGSSSQTIGGTTGNTFYNLTVNNASGITIAINENVAGLLNLSNGVVNTSNSNLLTLNDNATVTGASNTAYINGPLQKFGDDDFIFPVGKMGSGYHPIGISGSGSVTDALISTYRRGTAASLGPITAPGLQAISACEYWNLSSNSSSVPVDVTLTWDSNSGCNPHSYISDPNGIVAVHFDGTSWDNYGAGNVSGDATAGSVTWDNVSISNLTTTSFTLGSIAGFDNPLPVTFIDFKGVEKSNGIQLTFKVGDEINVISYEVEKSMNGSQFNKIGTIPATGKGSYEFTDPIFDKALINYRIKSMNINGGFNYSTIIAFRKGASFVPFKAFPTIVRNDVTLQHSQANSNTVITVITLDNKTLKSIKPSIGTVQTKIDLSTLSAGIYILKFSDGKGIVETSRIIRQ